jgi:hypothetical protein
VDRYDLVIITNEFILKSVYLKGKKNNTKRQEKGHYKYILGI